MSLTHLPSDPFSQIVARLSYTDRAALVRSHPSLALQLHPDNTSFWFDVYRTRFSSRPTAPPPSFITTPYAGVALRDLVDDLFIHSTLPMYTLHPSANSSPLVVSQNHLLYIACDNVFTTFRFANHRYLQTTRHILDAAVTSLSTSSDSTAVALGLANHSATLYSTCNKSFSRPIRGHRGPITATLLHAETLITGSADKTIRLRDATSRRSHAVLRGHDAPIAWLASASPTTFVSHGGADGRVKLWDVPRATCISTGRPGPFVSHAAVDAGGVVYAACGRSVSVLDPRMGLASTAAVLSLPRGSRWTGTGPIGAMDLASDGRLAAAVGGGGVAVWDAHGTWEARGLGWPRRWFLKADRRLCAVMLGGRGIVVGGGAKELLTFSVDGEYQGVVMEDRVRRAGVKCLLDVGEDGFVVGRVDGRVDYADVRSAEGEWKAAKTHLDEERKCEQRFWESPDDDLDGASWQRGRGEK